MSRAPLSVIIQEMQQQSDAVDDSYGSSAYEASLIALALTARHLLREYGEELLRQGREPKPPTP